jgi:hypothetical protein
MDRRDFMTALAIAGGAALLAEDGAAAIAAAGSGDAIAGRSRAAFHELLAVLEEAERRTLSPEWGIEREQEIAEGHRNLLHILATGLMLQAEADPDRPRFQPFVSPIRKFLGDNPDALYYFAPVRADRFYRIRGNIAGAAYTSFSFETGNQDGGRSTGVAHEINDRGLPVAADGSYELIIGPEPRAGTKGAFIKLEPGVGGITTRHYFETQESVAADPMKIVPLAIEPLDPVAPRPAPDDASIAGSIRRLAAWMRGYTLGQPPMMRGGQLPGWVSLVPNRFNPPAVPDAGIGLANRDAAYAIAPFSLKPEEALVIEGRFPACRFASLVLYNRYLQTFDYTTRRVSLNRAQTRLRPDGSYRMVLAHRDPGTDNWIDTEGRPTGTMQWRFVLPEGPIEPLRTRVVDVRDAGRF